MVKQTAKKVNNTVFHRTRSASKDPESGANGRRPIQNLTKSSDENEQQPTEYERILKKVEENRKRCGQSPAIKERIPAKSLKGKTKAKKVVEKVTATFQEDDNYVNMMVENPRDEIPTPSEEEDNNQAESSDEEEVNLTSKNNNASVEKSSSDRIAALIARTQRSSGAVVEAGLPATLDEGPSTSTGYRAAALSGASEYQMARRIEVMQNFVVKKGLITDDELQLLLNESDMDVSKENSATLSYETQEPTANSVDEGRKQPKTKTKQKSKGKNSLPNELSSKSEVTICRCDIKILSALLSMTLVYSPLVARAAGPSYSP